ncbi:MAG TPA: electron transfer flavoprotein subunit alpha, partial [Lachnoclostridium phytofermentans]|nr:electron transfer flavoprotein subunit alpha [Lachnoclostridium phytofermentans]
MAKLIINQSKIDNIKEFIDICPFGALEETEGEVRVNAACKMCKLCVKKGPEGAATYVEEKVEAIDKSLWKGIAVYVDHIDGDIHPVTYELIGKAKELAKKIHHPVYAIMMGSNIKDKCKELLHYGIDKIFVYDRIELDRFKIEPYTAVFKDFIEDIKPTAILVGATTVGRQLAPRVAARLQTGLTADCTILDMNEDTDLIQIRPAFGGNIMAQILTPNHRPQMATVRYKVMDAPKRERAEFGEILFCTIDSELLKTN